MAAPMLERHYTPEEYLARERRVASKSEYLDGIIRAMSGVSRAHSLINSNLAWLLGTQLRDRPCKMHVSDMRVKVRTSRMYTYPDMAVVCGEAQYEDAQGDTLLNPAVIIEILSPSTEAYDRGDKFGYYRQLPSLREYLLVAQDKVLVEHFVREDGGWLLTEAREPAAEVVLPAIACTLTLAEIYRKVDLSAASAPGAGAPAAIEPPTGLPGTL